MHVESRDSVSLKPAELDELGQLVSVIGISLGDSELDQQLEQFPLVVAVMDGETRGSCSGRSNGLVAPRASSGGSGARRGKIAPRMPRRAGRRVYRRAAISFPDEDVLVAGQVGHRGVHGAPGPGRRRPRSQDSPKGEEGLLGRLARRFGCDARYDDRTFR